MASPESIGIRREQALKRILSTSEVLGATQGLLPVRLANEQIRRRDPKLSEAMLLENIAEWLEDYANALALEAPEAEPELETAADAMAAAISGKRGKRR